jgi:hypothetical protein
LESKKKNEEKEIPTRFVVLLTKDYNTSADYILGLTNDSKFGKKARAPAERRVLFCMGILPKRLTKGCGFE